MRHSLTHNTYLLTVRTPKLFFHEKSSNYHEIQIKMMLKNG